MLKTLSFCKVDSWQSYNESVSVWLNRPNIVNKNLSCCTLKSLSLNDNHADAQWINDERIPLLTQNFAKNCLQLSNDTKCTNCDEVRSYTLATDEVDKPSFFLRKLIPRRPDLYCASYELVVKSASSFIFIPINFSTFLPECDYDVYVLRYTNSCVKSPEVSSECIHSNSGGISIAILSGSSDKVESPRKKIRQSSDNENSTPSSDLKLCFVEKSWMIKKLFPTLCKWCEEKNKSKSKLILPPSLSLIDQEKYSLCYHLLKQKYGVPLSQIWPEVTDPQKFVYEDVAIATYLLLLWEKERTLSGRDTKQSFVDLGCGNGLLVYILTREGHRGVGYDIRKRNIWDMYDEHTDLREATVTPDDLDLITDYDWLLGNHSDELTPWIPVMATRCGYGKKFWVLPCCFYDFYGKYERAQSALGQYDDYLTYVKDIAVKCEYEVQTDVMRIPSTKRVCFVGMRRTSCKSDHESIKTEVEELIASKRSALNCENQFIPRPAEIKVRNCTKIDRGIQDEVVQTISAHLLTVSNIVQSTSGKKWNRGGKISLSEAVILLTDNARKTMKRECGGLQTLLRNHNQVRKRAETRILQGSKLSLDSRSA